MKAAIILAAGESSRMGFPKQLAEYKGKTILETVVETVSNSIENSIVVLGHENETLTEKIDFKNSTILINESWEEGIISSIRTGLFYLSSDKNIDGVLIFMGDQPAINSEVIEKLLDPALISFVDASNTASISPIAPTKVALCDVVNDVTSPISP